MSATPAVVMVAGLWPFEPALLLGLALTTVLYLAGVTRAWFAAGVGRGVSVAQAVAGSLGLLALAVALASPLEPLSALLFSAHMAQHLLLVLVAAPLLVAGVPLLALLWLPPIRLRRRLVAGWRGCHPLRLGWHALSRPVVALASFVALLWGWHLPAAYQSALASTTVHALEHGSLLAAASLFWWSLLQPLGRRRLSPFGAPLLLFIAAVQGGVLGAMITLSPTAWYPHYQRVAEAAGFSALRDQQLAGLLMWVPPGTLYLAMACLLLYRGLVRVDTARQPVSQPARDGYAADRSRPAGSNLNSALAALVAIAVGLVAGTSEAQVLSPAGPAARSISSLWWVMLVLASVVCLVVFALLLLAVFRPRSPAGGRAPLGDGPFVVLGGIVIPIVILVPLLLYSLGITAGLVRPAEDAVTIEVIGHQWWWEVRYPDSGVVGANEIHVPAGRPVRLRLTSADVIHSFWAPGLQGKMDLIPGTVNDLWIEVDEVGIHSAKCAEFCGAQHANMRLLVVAESEESLGEWLSRRAQTPAPPREQVLRKGQEVFLSSACVNCHTVAGTSASGEVGPDLTHLASRMTLGAGTVANNRGNLGGWIVNSQAIKPGNRMPPMYLESADLQALLAYLESLE
ncbi:MAG: cytochrome c oxidase subunit II [Trueperaceae bacterium]